MVKITALSLYIINQVKFRRLVIGMPAKRLSKILDHSSNYVFVIESLNREASYPPHEWPKLAVALNCTVHDLLPPEKNNSTGELVEKVVLSLSNKADLNLVIEGLISYGFFDRPKAIDEIAKHLFIEKQEQLELLYKVMDGFLQTGYLKQRALEYYRDIV